MSESRISDVPSAGSIRTETTGSNGGWIERLLAPLFVIGLGAGFRLLWLMFTNFTQEDAFITFRFAQQIVRGNGFVYNIGERVYGTTTPLFTLLLAGWLQLSQRDIISGARTVDLIAAVGAMVFVWLTLRRIGAPPWQPVFVLVILAVSTRLWVFDTQGMEMPLVILFLSASWWMFSQNKAGWAGALAGAVLWTRIDVALWPACMVVVALSSGRKREALQIGLWTTLVYLPWLVFAGIYFGSPIPYTAIAKYVAYVAFDHTPLTTHALIILRALRPFFIDLPIPGAGILLSLATVAIAIWQGLRLRTTPTYLVLLVFAVVEAVRLILTRATSFAHYSVPTLWGFLVLFGAGLATLWSMRKGFAPVARKAYSLALLFVLVVGLAQGVMAAFRTQDTQVFRHELALKAIGLWLRENTPEQATVLLEPLGYIGYYSDRHMFDEVGLVTPQIVALKRKQLAAPAYIEALTPDYYLIHCDDVLRWFKDQEDETAFFRRNYTHVATFNPVAFDPTDVYEDPSYAAFARNACYEVWGIVTR